MEYMWVTNKDIGQSFYRKCLKTIKYTMGR